MYAWLFRRLPGPLPVRILIAVILLAAIIAVLFQWVFPSLAPYMPFNDGTLDALAPAPPADRD